MKTDTYASPAALARTPEELLESMTGMFLPPSAMGEVNGLKILCLQRENARLQMELDGSCNAEELRQEREARQKAEAEVERLRDAFSKLTDEIECTPWCTSHEAGRCDCKRLTRAYAISDSISQSPTK